MIEMEGMYDEDIKIRSNNKQWRKLVDYFNQMREEKFHEKGYFEYTMRFDNVHIISKNMGFIERLVKNQKIDRHSKKLELDMKRMRIPQDYYIGGLQSLTLQHKKAQYLSLIALLSVQENPITFILNILE